MKIVRTILTMFTVSLLMVMFAAGARADTKFNKRTVVTFTQPVEIPGQVLPSGTYTIELYRELWQPPYRADLQRRPVQADRNRAGDSEPAADADQRQRD